MRAGSSAGSAASPNDSPLVDQNDAGPHVSGSATADAVGLGGIEIRAMELEGYDKRFSVGVTAASALLSPIIPPSIVLVAFAVQAQVPVGALFFASIVPGLLMALDWPHTPLHDGVPVADDRPSPARAVDDRAARAALAQALGPVGERVFAANAAALYA